MATLRSDATYIRDKLTRDVDQTWGFFIYRTCYYNDDARWENFLERIRHRELMRSMRSLYEDYDATLVQHGFPIIVDKEALDSVLEEKAPAE
ncbi:hypothetical protein N7499_002621 [Penicillium canescens]|uniref:Uncharacterized protein n=1 Tax=Penicillium canescens TaxID=5083 RepID=A0AAD6N6I8_PENCN|nr:uncharacterized protein N7446_010232 [Penicillium canescens]KAJ6035470.1 hypothetical protein N7460_009645 [Penicillium canescens]KAJ6037593.1 hypothetical protein N7444_010298 [Penicillium canescens]KAJ6054220.1 hypothetical protein N7446_010232 [Penicillium canescens]KAJ6098247.1 hypothetical protein N7499_002621 [Penicillium canescens]KAJ6166236.1 hypothetical protein N7485_009480 [Penicillium canescens]